MYKDNLLFYGDNLKILRDYLADSSIDLIYLDPPFNSERAYNIIFQDKEGNFPVSQIRAFDDTWSWNEETEMAMYELSDPKYSPELFRTLKSFKEILGTSNLMAYLVMMGVRLLELRRVLKETGAIYLHCDPTASHYLKILMDQIFGVRNYLNEITWKRYAVHSLSKKRFDTISDRILYYAKDKDKVKFNYQYEELTEEELERRFPYVEKETGRRYQTVSLEQSSNKSSKGEIRIINGIEVKTELGWRWSQETFDEKIRENPYIIHWTKSGRPRYKIYADEFKGKPLSDLWIDIPYLSSSSSERLGYPTQKPVALLERIIKASSDEGDIVLDPFCGCGTTIAAAEKLRRRWIGIDITILAINIIEKRIREHFPDAKYIVQGVPNDIESAKALAKQSKLLFEQWFVMTLGGQPYKSSGGADSGIDGFMYFKDPLGNDHTIIISVKGGNYSIEAIRSLKSVVDRENASLGLLLTLNEPTKGMLSEAASAGLFVLPGTQKTYPKIQIFTVADYFAGKKPNIPEFIYSIKKAKRLLREGDAPTLLDIS